jgi:hypothetical protein
VLKADYKFLKVSVSSRIFEVSGIGGLGMKSELLGLGCLGLDLGLGLEGLGSIPGRNWFSYSCH